MALCRSFEPSSPDCRLLNSLPKAASTSPVTEPDLRKSKSPDHYLTAVSTSQQSTSTAESPLMAPFHADTKLVATIPTTTGAASAVAASDSNPAFGNPLHGEAGFMLANLGDTAPNSAAVMSNSHEPSTPQCYPLLNRGCNDKGTIASLLGTAAQAGASLAPKSVIHNKGRRATAQSQNSHWQPFRQQICSRVKYCRRWICLMRLKGAVISKHRRLHYEC